jgi:hypothetical protein
VRELATFAGSPEDKATYAKWRRGIVIFYGSVGLVAVAVFLAAHFSHLAFHAAFGFNPSRVETSSALTMSRHRGSVMHPK